MVEKLVVRELYKSYNGKQVLSNISFDVAQNEVFAILGSSGCGKSTILNLIAGIETPDKGQIRFSGYDVMHLPPYQRNFGLMFQEFALFPHMNVENNVAFGLKMQGKSREFIRDRVSEVLDIVDLNGYQNRDVTVLSGGERQRVAFARTLAPNPELILLDEPLGSLDRRLRDSLLERLRTILTQTGIPAIYVTHDPYEALVISDRIAIMKDGRFIEINQPDEIFLCPKTDYTAKFIGIENIFEGEVIQDDGISILHSVFGDIPIPNSETGPVTFSFKPGYLTTSAKSENDFVIQGFIEESMFTGHDYLIKLSSGTATIKVHLKPTEVITSSKGDQMTLFFNPSRAVHIFENIPT